MSKLTFNRNKTTGTFTATGPKQTGLTVFKDAEGRWRWRQAPRYGKPVVSDQMFLNEDDALDDLLTTLAVAECIDL
jgi:hypothetical protein